MVTEFFSGTRTPELEFTGGLGFRAFNHSHPQGVQGPENEQNACDESELAR